MEIMSLNGWGGRLGEALTAYVAGADPDILCLQEVVHTPASQRDWLSYRDDGRDLPQRANFLAEVSNALPNHRVIFCPAAQGDLWDGADRVPSQWGLASFIRDTIPIIAQHHGFVHGTFSADGYGAHPRSRTAHAMRVFDLEHEVPLVIAHMHGLRELAGKQDTPERSEQARRLADMMRCVAEADDGMIACGDFNVLPGSHTFSILGELGLTDLVTRAGTGGTRTSHYAKPGRHADYMLVNANVGVAGFEIVRFPEISDHCPLVLKTERKVNDNHASYSNS
jgi:endonuclease/exonuclease/phosphatase family metal-dependent hydrolase